MGKTQRMEEALAQVSLAKAAIVRGKVAALVIPGHCYDSPVSQNLDYPQIVQDTIIIVLTSLRRMNIAGV
jgi:hypothetical protein